MSEVCHLQCQWPVTNSTLPTLTVPTAGHYGEQSVHSSCPPSHNRCPLHAATWTSQMSLPPTHHHNFSVVTSHTPSQMSLPVTHCGSILYALNVTHLMRHFSNFGKYVFHTDWTCDQFWLGIYCIFYYVCKNIDCNCLLVDHET